MSTWIIVISSLAVLIATFLLGEWLANDGSPRSRNRQPRRRPPAEPDDRG